MPAVSFMIRTFVDIVLMSDIVEIMAKMYTKRATASSVNSANGPKLSNGNNTNLSSNIVLF